MPLLEVAVAAFMIVASLAIVILNLKLRDVTGVTLIARTTENRVKMELSAMSKDIQKLREQIVEVSNEVRILKLREGEGEKRRIERGELTLKDLEKVIELAVTKAAGREVSYQQPEVVAKVPPVTVARRPRTAKLSSTEMKVLEMLTTPKTYKDVVEALGVTREHAARILKKLHELGYVTRDTDKRPYTYVRVRTQRS